MTSQTAGEHDEQPQSVRSVFLRQWTWYLIKRLGILVIVLLAVSILTFSVTRFAGTPLYAAVGVYSTEEMIEDR